MEIAVIIPAAGAGKRMGAGINKQLLTLKGENITGLTLKQFIAQPLVSEIILVVHPDDEEDMKKALAPYTQGVSKTIKWTYGGKERQDSVANGAKCVGEKITHIMVHDGARPFVTKTVFQNIVEALKNHDAVIPVVPSKDTLKRIKDKGVKKTIDRSHVVRVQTPQAFTKGLFRGMMLRAKTVQEHYTDDASIVEAMGLYVHVVNGSEWNIKLTTPEDMVIGEAIYQVVKGEGLCE